MNDSLERSEGSPAFKEGVPSAQDDDSRDELHIHQDSCEFYIELAFPIKSFHTRRYSLPGDIEMFLCRRIGTFFAAIFWAQSSHASVTWEDQAERLQNISAALLDNMPMGEMLEGTRHISLKTNVSFLPKTNSSIGAKTEKVPSSPVHAVPTIQQDAFFDVASGYSVGLRVWGGYLPVGSEKIVGLKAKMTQRSYGAALLQRFKWGTITPGVEIGQQRSASKVTGAITATDAHDTFSVNGKITYASLGIRVESLGLWSSLLCASRVVDSEFAIPSDSTSLKLTDSGSASTQMAGGWEHSSGINVGLAQLYVPNRLSMTRVLMGLKINW